MAFYKWLKENTVELNESYSKTDMEWFAELAWNACSRTHHVDYDVTCGECGKGMTFENRIHITTYVCEECSSSVPEPPLEDENTERLGFLGLDSPEPAGPKGE